MIRGRGCSIRVGRNVTIRGVRGPRRAVPSARSSPSAPEETPGAEPAPRQVLREPGRRHEPDGHAPPPPPAAQADRHLPVPARPRGRRARHRLGRADRRRRRRHLDLLHAARHHPEHRLVRAPRVRDPAGSAARLHARPGRRAGHRRVRPDRSGRRPTSRRSPRASCVRHQRDSSRWSCSASKPARTSSEIRRAGRRPGPGGAEACDRVGGSHWRPACPEPACGSARPSGRGGSEPGDRRSAAQHATAARPVRRRHGRVLQVRGARHQHRDRDASRPDDVLRHGLHHLPERRHPRCRVQARSGRHRGRLGRDGPHRRDHDHRDGAGRELPAGARGRPRHQRHRGLLADGARPDAPGRDGRDRPRGHRRHPAGPRRLPGGGHERRPARPQARDRRRHRPVHPVHRLRRTVASSRHQPVGAPIVGPVFPTTTAQFLFLAASCSRSCCGCARSAAP